MKLIRGGLITIVAYFMFFYGSTNLVSCKKEIIHDTVIVIDKDTVTLIDSSHDINDCLVAYYNFVGGNLKDSSGLNNHIVFNNATPTTDRFGNANGAYLFNGTSSYMRVTNHASLNPSMITLMAIVKLNGFYTGPCHQNQIFMKGFDDQSNGIYGLRVSDLPATCSSPLDTTKEYVHGYYGNNQFNSVGAIDRITPVRTQKWMIVVFTYDGNEAKIYVDGVLKEASTITRPFTTNTNDLFIGRVEDPGYVYPFNGVIDEIRIYNKALKAHEVHKFQSLKY